MGKKYHKKHRNKRPHEVPDQRLHERIFAPVWKCIYCGYEGGKKLGREHVIPLGLKGNAILPRASCSACGAITGKVEAIVTNGNFGTFRRVMNISSGRRPPPTELLRLAIKNPDGSLTQKDVHPTDYPAQLLLPKLPLPGVLTGNIKAPLICNFEWVDLSYSQKLAIEERLGGEVVTKAWFDVYAFARMLAKIGHGLAVGELGLENFQPYAVNFILGNEPELIGGLIGQSEWVPDGKRTHDAMHHVYIMLIPFEGRDLVLVGVHLFCRHTPIAYSVVVGELTPKASFWQWDGLKRLRPDELAAFRARYDNSPG